MVGFGAYGICSTVMTMGVVSYATSVRDYQFYPTAIYLVTSKLSVVVLGNFLLMLTVLFGKVTKYIFLGQLRQAEVENLYENARFTITETFFALTIFREEINLKVMALFVCLLFAKIFHWLTQSRLEHIEQVENVSRWALVRLFSLMICLSAVDFAYVCVCGYEVYGKGPSVLIFFGYEFLILFITLTAMFLRYVLHLVELRSERNNDNNLADNPARQQEETNRANYLFYLELATEVIKLFVYLVFFLVIYTYYGMPLYIIRDLWVSVKNLQRKISTYFRYRQLTANMNERFPNATEEELAESGDRTCIICREEMTIETAKKLPCLHIFHLHCLRMWLQRQQSCPTCRSNIPINAPTPTPAPIPPADAQPLPQPQPQPHPQPHPQPQLRPQNQERNPAIPLPNLHPQHPPPPHPPQHPPQHHPHHHHQPPQPRPSSGQNASSLPSPTPIIFATNQPFPQAAPFTMGLNIPPHLRNFGHGGLPPMPHHIMMMMMNQQDRRSSNANRSEFTSAFLNPQIIQENLDFWQKQKDLLAQQSKKQQEDIEEKSEKVEPSKSESPNENSVGDSIESSSQNIDEVDECKSKSDAASSETETTFNSPSSIGHKSSVISDSPASKRREELRRRYNAIYQNKDDETKN